MRKTSPNAHPDFHIATSREDGDAEGLQPAPDFAPCGECLAEMQDPSDRRYGYAFITCTQCGPRFSVMDDLPYDRRNTSMVAFDACPACSAEYADPSNRRFHSQTNSCPDCGITMRLHDSVAGECRIPQSDMLPRVAAALQSGHIVAVKSIGGYLLLCDAGSEDTVRRLRDRKRRPEKPLALLYPDLQRVAASYRLSPEEERELTGHAAPILLLRPASTASVSLPWDEIAPGLDRIGVMLPASPLLHALSALFGRPLVATSGNVSGSPIIHDDGQALLLLTQVADLILSHDREIVTPQDDSVMRFTPSGGRRILIRRSRGFAPSLSHQRSRGGEAVFACGALLKSTFTLGYGRDAFVSQYLGDTDVYEAQSAYRDAAERMMTLFPEKPAVVIADRHPGYFSSRYAEELGRSLDATVVAVPHHKAHAAAVLAENGLLGADTPVLCVVWDGTGLGDDGNAWGGEFFLHRDGRLERLYHFVSFEVIAGDKMAMEPRLSAISVCHAVGLSLERMSDRFTPQEWRVYKSLLGQSTVRTTSVGRLFDAVASLALGCDRQSFEGQAAMLLERHASAHLEDCNTLPQPYPDPAIDAGGGVCLSAWMTAILGDLDAGASAGEVAARFHVSLASLVVRIARAHGLRSIACSGGVFQNALLVDLLEQMLPEDHRLLLHRELPPNDENVSFGQMACWDHDIDGCRKRCTENTGITPQTAETYRSEPKSNRNHVFGNTRTDKVH